MLLRAGGSGSGGGGSGNVTGAASSTDNALVRFDGITGKIIQDYTSTPIIGSDTGSLTINKVPAASDPALVSVGTPFTGGTATTNFPAWYYNVTGATPVTSFSAAGTWLGCNMPSGFTGNFLHCSVNGASPVISATAAGAMTISSTFNAGGTITSSGNFTTTTGSLTLGATASIVYTGNARIRCTGSNAISIRNAADSADANLTAGVVTASAGLNLSRTITPGGTTGAQTINLPAGSVNFAIGASTLVVTNSLVTANSLVFLTILSNDASLNNVWCVPTAGSFTIYGDNTAAAETRVGFLVTN